MTCRNGGVLTEMILNPERIATREKLILTGIYLSKYGDVLAASGSGSGHSLKPTT